MPRLDAVLVARGFYTTRSRARDAILRGAVTVEDRIATKPGEAADEDAAIRIADAASGYVSRAALKLIHALDHFDISPQALEALDLGVSTGGFTQVLLERGARHVTAIDVGHGQLADTLAQDPRVTLIEGLNARDLKNAHLKTPPEIIVADLSFISLKLALPPALALAASGARLVALVKPQFEAGRAALDGNGVVRDKTVAKAAAEEIARWLEAEQGWQVAGLTDSPIAGSSGNREFLLLAIKP
ncbi:MAG: TlyA family RNA methyltransferase [Parvibaculaceae bacterium]